MFLFSKWFALNLPRRLFKMNGSISASNDIKTVNYSICRGAFLLLCLASLQAWRLPNFLKSRKVPLLLRRRLSRPWSDSSSLAWHGMRAVEKQIDVLQSVEEVFGDRSTTPASATTTAATSSVSRHLPSCQPNDGSRWRRSETSQDEPGRDEQVYERVQAGAQGDEDQEGAEVGSEGHVPRLYHLVHGVVECRKDDHCFRPWRVPRL